MHAVQPFSICFVSVQGGLRLNSEYKGASVYGSVGSSVTFTWSFSGGFIYVSWGLKIPNQNDVIVLVALDPTGMLPFSPPAPGKYRHRVRGSFNGNSSSAQAIFTLSNITKDDERLFGCKIIAPDLSTLFDLVQLVVVGEWSFIEVPLLVSLLVALFS